MALQMHVDVVSAERLIFSGPAEQLHLRGEVGELGIFPRHSPLMTRIMPGLLRLVLPEGRQESYFVYSGYLEVQPHMVTVLADTLLRSDELDGAAALAAQEMEHHEGRRLDFDKELALNIALLRALDEVKKAGKSEP